MSRPLSRPENRPVTRPVTRPAARGVTGTGPYRLAILLTPDFNLSATVGFLDPFRAANYLAGAHLYRWRVASVAGGPCRASNGLTVETEPLVNLMGFRPDLAAVSASWSPERKGLPALVAALRSWARRDCRLVGLDTGAFILAQAGLLSGRRATVHYEHIDAFAELYPEIEVTEALFEVDGPRMTSGGGAASVDLALHLLTGIGGPSVANAAARYIFHGEARPPGAPQNPERAEPLGATAPAPVRRAIRIMEAHLEDPLSIPDICQEVGISQRQLDRLFAASVGKSPALYYRDIRLDRARGFVTQTDMRLCDVAVASGFTCQSHFSRAYRERFGLPPRRDRVEGRVPFEFRAWPMHRPTPDGEDQ